MAASWVSWGATLVSQCLVSGLLCPGGWLGLPPSVREALRMFAEKITRVVRNWHQSYQQTGQGLVLLPNLVHAYSLQL